jgi:HAD superfamily hydrolase (TIGR01509 family)
MFEAVIFDWDGTLADTRQVVIISFQKALRAAQCTVSGEFIERRIGIGAAETFKEILRASGKHFDETLIMSLVDTKVQAEIDLSSRVKLFEGASELLESLRGKVKIALASMNNREVVNHLLNAMNIRKFFDVVLTVNDVHHSKPDPEIFLKSALQLESRPEKCVVVEDSIFGVEAAEAAEMACIAVLTGVYSRKELEKANPDLIVNSLMEKGRIHNFIFPHSTF